MTRHKALHTGLVSPSPLDRLINALLRSFAMLVSHVAHLCSMRLIRPVPECHSETTHEVLPCGESGKLKETIQAAANSQPPEALMVSSTRSVRPSNHEGGLTAPSPSHSRARPENLWAPNTGGASQGDACTRRPKILGSSPRMTRGWARAEIHQACAPN